MKQLATTKMSSKGQVVIPEDVRSSMGLKSGDQFIVIGNKDVVILKSIAYPSMDEFKSLIKEAKTQARKAKLRKSDIKKAIETVRNK